MADNSETAVCCDWRMRDQQALELGRYLAHIDVSKRYRYIVSHRIVSTTKIVLKFRPVRVFVKILFYKFVMPIAERSPSTVSRRAVLLSSHVLRLCDLIRRQR